MEFIKKRAIHVCNKKTICTWTKKIEEIKTRIALS